MRQEDMYQNKTVLAPMVRVCTLPMRLLALDYGADLVYCEEQIDRKILMCEIKENKLLHTTDFTLSDGTVVLRTCPAEKDKLILQLGTCDAKRALAAAKKLQNYVAGVDINMGCPKEFSIKGGMGAALLTQPEKVKQLEDTVKLAKLIESTGVSALAVHGRTKDERSRDPNRTDYIKAVADAVSIPVIANGNSKNITSLTGAENFKKATGASSVMLARAAMWNCSVFRKQGPLPVLEVLKSYLRYAFQYDNNDLNTKYCVLQMLHDRMVETPEADRCVAAKTLQDFANIWAMKSEYEKILQQRLVLETEMNARTGGDCNGVKRRKMDDGSILIELPVRFEKRLYPLTMTPKQILNNWSKKSGFGKPVYTTIERGGDRYYSSTVLFEGKVYANPYWEKSKQMAEQSVAVACLVANGESDGRLTEPPNETEELRRKWRNLINSGVVDGGDHATLSVSCNNSSVVVDSSSDIHVNSVNNSVTHIDSANNSMTHVDSADSSVTHVDNDNHSATHNHSDDSSVTHVDDADSSVTHIDTADNSMTHVDNADSSVTHIDAADSSMTHVDNDNHSATHGHSADHSMTYIHSADSSVTHDQVVKNG